MNESSESEPPLPRGSSRYTHFPFVTDDVRLHDTNTTVYSGVRMALAHFKEATNCYQNEELYMRIWEDSEEEESTNAEVLNFGRELEVSPSPVSKPVLRFMESEVQSEPGAIAMRVRAALAVYGGKDERAMGVEVENYVINCVAQREPRSHKWSDDDLVDCVGDLLTEKYFDDHIDDFVDRITSVMHFNLVRSEPALQKRTVCPSFYSAYVLVWKYDADFHGMYDAGCFVDDYFSLLHVAHGDGWGQMRDLLQKSGLLMNVEKFRYYFLRRPALEDVCHNDECSIYLDDLVVGTPISTADDYFPTYESESLEPRSAKAVHFESSPQLLHINQQEAPAYVYLDAVQ